MNSKTPGKPMFVSQKYLKLAGDRKKIIDFAKFLATKMRKVYPFNIEMENVMKEIMHNPSLSQADRVMLNQRRKELKAELDEERRRHSRMFQEPLVDNRDEIEKTRELIKPRT
jgi:hypothetical protein